MRQLAYLQAMGIDVWRRRTAPAPSAQLEQHAVQALLHADVPPANTPAVAAIVKADVTSPAMPPPAARTLPAAVPAVVGRTPATAMARFSVRVLRLGSGVALVDSVSAESARLQRFVGDLLLAVDVPAGPLKLHTEFVWPPRGNQALGAEPETARAALAGWFDRVLAELAPTAAILTGAAATAIEPGAGGFARSVRSGVPCVLLADADAIAGDAARKRALWSWLSQPPP